MKRKARIWEFESTSTLALYETILWNTLELTCNCPVWTQRVTAAGERSCKHTKNLLAMFLDYAPRRGVSLMEAMRRFAEHTENNLTQAEDRANEIDAELERQFLGNVYKDQLNARSANVEPLPDPWQLLTDALKGK